MPRHAAHSEQPPKRQTTLAHYGNHKIAVGENIDVLHNIPPDNIAFYHTYIQRRKPVKFGAGYPRPRQPEISKPEIPSSAPASDQPLNLVNPIKGVIDLDRFGPQNLVSTLDYTQPLQVERKYRYGFGSGQERVKHTLAELVDLFREGHSEYYLTTQYNEDADESESDEDEEEQQLSGENNESQGELSENEESSEDEANPGGNTLNLESIPETQSQSQLSDLDSDSSIDLENIHDDYEEDEDEDQQSREISAAEVSSRVRELLQPPLTNLVKHPDILPLVPDLFKTLVPQQINLWMGQSSSSDDSQPPLKLDPKDKTFGLGKYLPGTRGTSSGLHHDHADNLYVLVSGRKRFTLFSPADALTLRTVGDIYKIYNSGIIDYEVNQNAPTWKHIRDDGALVEEIIHWKLEQLEDDETLESELLSQLDDIRKQNTYSGERKQNLDPPNFSVIPPGLLHLEEFEDPEVRKQLTDFANKHFPGLLELNRYTVWLEPGEMLYLPAGWFHEVSSFGPPNNSKGSLEDVHIALNYWFVPPNTEDPLKPYADGYWYDDWERTKQCIAIANTTES